MGLMDIEAAVARSTAASGVPLKVEDPDVLQAVALMVGGDHACRPVCPLEQEPLRAEP